MLIEKTLIQLIELEYDIVFVCNYIPKFRYQYISPAIEKIIGYSPDNFYNNPEIREKTLHPEDLSELLIGLMSNKNTYTKIMRYFHKNGNIVWLDTKYSLFKDESGNIVNMLGMAKKVTDKDKLNFELTQDSSQTAHLINKTHGIAKINIENGTLIYVNEKLCKILKYEQKDLINKNVCDLILEKNNIKIFKKNETFNQRFLDKEGNTIFLNINSSINKDIYGFKNYYLAIFEDVTKDKLYESEIVNHQNKLQTILTTSGHFVWTVSENIEITQFNRNNYKIKNNTIEPLKIMDIGLNTVNINNPNYEIWIKKYSAAFSGESQRFEIVNLNENGDEVWIDVFLLPIYDGAGKIIEVSAMAQDITSRKKNQKIIIQSLKEKEILLSEIHHRVKNNLQVIISILNLQSSFIKDKKARNYFNECQERIRSMAHIHETLYRNKDFSNIRFDEYIKVITQNLLGSYRQPNKTISIKYNLDPIAIDLDQSIPCGLILNELVSNSIKYAFPGKRKGIIKIVFNMINEQFIFKVSDDGIGLSDKIDFRNTESLGLQLVVTLVEQLNGNIELNKKTGTEFLITFTKYKNK